MTDRSQATPKVLTPLWIIALFLSLAETILGIAVTQTSGGIQVSLTVFVLSFPVLVAIGFFAILWNRPYVFYSPSEFGALDVLRYVEAMQRSPSPTPDVYSLVQDQIRTTLGSAETISALREALNAGAGSSLDGDIAEALTRIAATTSERVRGAGFLSFDSRPLLQDRGQEWNEVFADFSSVSDLLDTVWSRLAPHVPPFTYAKSWAIQDAASGRIFTSLGSAWARQSGAQRDYRPLHEVGLAPGMRLHLIPAVGPDA